MGDYSKFRPGDWVRVTHPNRRHIQNIKVQVIAGTDRFRIFLDWPQSVPLDGMADPARHGWIGAIVEPMPPGTPLEVAISEYLYG